MPHVSGIILLTWGTQYEEGFEVPTFQIRLPLYVFIMSRTRFRVIPLSIVA